MRCAVFLVLAALSGCAPAAVGLAATDIISVPVFGRSFGDIGYSAATGRDCSIVRLDERKTYCAPADLSPRPQRYCTRTLARVDCWADPYLVPQHQAEVGDTPPPTADQLRYRAAPWPKSLFF